MVVLGVVLGVVVVCRWRGRRVVRVLWLGVVVVVVLMQTPALLVLFREIFQMTCPQVLVEVRSP